MILEASVSTQPQKEESGGLRNATDPSQEPAELLGTAALFICPDLRFTPRTLDLLTERSLCPSGICGKYDIMKGGGQRTHLLWIFESATSTF